MSDVIKTIRSWKVGNDSLGRIAVFDLLLFIIVVYYALRSMGVKPELAVLVAVPGVPPFGA